MAAWPRSVHLRHTHSSRPFTRHAGRATGAPPRTWHPADCGTATAVIPLLPRRRTHRSGQEMRPALIGWRDVGRIADTLGSSSGTLWRCGRNLPARRNQHGRHIDQIRSHGPTVGRPAHRRALGVSRTQLQSVRWRTTAAVLAAVDPGALEPATGSPVVSPQPLPSASQAGHRPASTDPRRAVNRSLCCT